MTAMKTTKPIGTPLDADTIPEAFQRVVAQCADQVGLRTVDESTVLTWREVGDQVAAVSAGLAGLGIGHSDTVAMILPNTIDSHIVDYATQHIGAIPFAIFNSSAPAQIEHQLRVSGTRILFTESAFMPRVVPALEALDGQITHLVVLDAQVEGALSLADVMAAARSDFDFEATWRSVEADDISNLIYTSGTTGVPKGAQWAHRTVLAQQRALDEAFPMPHHGVISFLPLAHAGGRITALYAVLAHGASITVCPNMTELPAALATHRPDALFGVPRVWEKLQVGIETIVAHQPEAVRTRMQAAIEDGIAHAKAAEVNSGVSADELAVLKARADEAVEVLRPVVARVGLDRARCVFVGGAPSAPELSLFFRAVGVPMLEAYGSTEACLNIFNRIDHFKAGTAGTPLPGVEVSLAEDGELFARSAMTFVDYRGMEHETAATIDGEGWLHTGDVAAIDSDGFVRIIDRKKELIINSAGKNMSPAYIESTMKGETSLIGQVVAIGDKRKYVTALITLDPEALSALAEKLGLTGRPLEELAASDEVRAEVAAAVQRGNERLNSNEQIKSFHILSNMWLPDSDELTPTAKLKRRIIHKKYSADIDAMYTGAAL